MMRGTDMKLFLASSIYIDSHHPQVAAKAAELAAGCTSEHMLVTRCFEFVRDVIKHSLDFNLDPVTCRASDVLRHGSGYCYAKSHLLAALLRANGIAAGLCYQRRALGSQFCLHGLNAVYLQQYGWYRIDARGNKPGIEAAFSPPLEKLAYLPLGVGEGDLPGILDQPLPAIVRALTGYATVQEVADNLPDIELPAIPSIA